MCLFNAVLWREINRGSKKARIHTFVWWNHKFREQEETTNSSGYSPENGQEIVDRPSRSYFIGFATSEMISRYLKDSVQDSTEEKLLMLRSDAPNVN